LHPTTTWLLAGNVVVLVDSVGAKVVVVASCGEGAAALILEVVTVAVVVGAQCCKLG
jgi:hypothetical protein